MTQQRVRLVGIGCGDPFQLTLEAVGALQSADFAVMTRKGDDDPLAAARQALIDRHAPDLQVIDVVDPERDRSRTSTATQAGYESVVLDWHAARAEAWRSVLEQGWADHGPQAVVLVWGDPAFYDSTIRVLERVGAEFDVDPGISAVQLLAARHRIVLHEIGRPVLVTTARRLRQAVDAGADNVVVMLGAEPDLAGFDDWSIWWGANLGTASERLVSGRVGDVAADVLSARADVREDDGWVMDVYRFQRNT